MEEGKNNENRKNSLSALAKLGQKATDVLSAARLIHLNVAKERFTQASLGRLSNQRKRQIGLLKSLRTIKTLQRTDVCLSEMLEEEDYPGAIQLCLECQKAASTFRLYSCISEFNSKLQDTLEQIEDVQLKVKTYLLGTDMSNFKYDDFIFVLHIISSFRLMQVDEKFCGSKSEALQESIRKQSINYFNNDHRTRLKELRMFLENETWELCPVKSSFSILQLHEFKCLGQSRSPSMSPSKQNSSTESAAASLFEQYLLQMGMNQMS